MTPLLRLSMTAILLSFCLATRAGDAQGASAKLRATSALFGQFETIFCTDAGALAAHYNQLPAHARSFLRIPFASLTNGLRLLGRHALREILTAGDHVLVGAKDFRAPAGLGGVKSRFCYVIVLRKRGGLNLPAAVGRQPVARWSGEPAWAWQAPPQEGSSQPFTFYMTEVARTYVIVSNNSDDLRSMSGRLSSRNGGSPTMAKIPEWQEVSRQDYWGYRRYQQTTTADKDAAGMSDVTSAAKDLIFLADFKRKRGLLRLLATDASTADKINAAPTDPAIALPPLKPTTRGVWEAVIPFAGNEQAAGRMFIVMSLFGFGIYL
jgi:hypothetical protein